MPVYDAQTAQKFGLSPPAGENTVPPRAASEPGMRQVEGGRS